LSTPVFLVAMFEVAYFPDSFWDELVFSTFRPVLDIGLHQCSPPRISLDPSREQNDIFL
jgi:hypothetical protein